MLFLDELAQFLDHVLSVHQFVDDPNGVYRSSNRPIYRIGLTLEAFPDLVAWVKRDRLDALFLHRPWQLPLEQLPSDLGILSYHLAFDERLTIGCNSRLAHALHLSEIEELGEKAGRTIGMIGNIPLQTFDGYRHSVEQIFGGLEAVKRGEHHSVTRVAVVGAMSDALVREASRRGATLYVTGQIRRSAELSITETGIGVIATGHRRAEAWGLRALAGILRDRWSMLEVVLMY